MSDLSEAFDEDALPRDEDGEIEWNDDDYDGEADEDHALPETV